MFNCYCILWNDSVFAILRTEQACLNMVEMFAKSHSPAPKMTVEGRYIPDVWCHDIQS